MVQRTVEHSMPPTHPDMVATIQQTRKPKQRIPSEKWEGKRPLITRLYQVERRSLHEVMQILKRDDWDPTVKMYKSRIWKWGLDKKLKSDEVLAILLLKQERDAQQKPSQFTIRGQPVDMDNINRYVKRNAGLLSRVRAGERPSVQSSHEVACYTPPPSPTNKVATNIGAPASTPPSLPDTAISPYTAQQANHMTPYHNQALVPTSGQIGNPGFYGGGPGAAHSSGSFCAFQENDSYLVGSWDSGAADQAAYSYGGWCYTAGPHAPHDSQSSRHSLTFRRVQDLPSSQALSLQS